MNQPIIYINEHFTEEQIQTIKETAPLYKVISSSKELSEVNEDFISILLGWDKKLGQRLLDSPTSQLQWVQSVSAGVDSYDFSAFTQKNILLSNGSGIHSISIAEHVLGTLLTEFRGIRQSILQQSTNVWKNNSLSYQQLSGQKMLIVGTGQIGQQLAKFAQGLDIQTYGVNTSGHSKSGFIECYSQKNISRIIHEMTIVVNILPLTKDTFHLFDTHLFQEMKNGTVFVNVGRGPSVDTNALISMLKNGKISFAALDVFEEEPLPVDSPLWKMDNVLITPHISGLTPKFKSKLLAIFLPNLKSFITDGTLVKNEVSLNKGY